MAIPPPKVLGRSWFQRLTVIIFHGLYGWRTQNYIGDAHIRRQRERKVYKRDQYMARRGTKQTKKNWKKYKKMQKMMHKQGKKKQKKT